MELKEHYDGGKVGYEAYCKQTGGVSLISGDKLPEFENLKDNIKDAWAAAYMAIVNKLARQEILPRLRVK